MKKIFVLDTNVLLHDHMAIYHFEENDIVIPITVLEELDKFKKGSDMINFQAREFMRELDRISGDMINGGIALGKDRGTLFIETGKPFSEEMKASFIEPSADHRILAVADFYRKKHPETQVVLVTQDINFRMKAKSLHIMAQDYQTGKVQSIKDFEDPYLVINKVADAAISKLYAKEDEGMPIDKLDLETTVKDRYFVLDTGTANALVHNDVEKGIVSRVEKRRAYGIYPRNAEQAFAIDALMRPDIKLVTIMGKAGTGKTLLALAAALEQRHDFQQIFLARPIIPLGNRDIGFLPGDAKDKIGPYMQPLFDNLSVIKHKFKQQSPEFHKIEEMLKTEKLLISPLAYIRGRSLSNVFFIVDEAQNLTPHEVKTIITRAGEGTKMVFTGDIQQIDSPYLDAKSNGLSFLTDKMQGQSLFAHVNLVKGERSHLADLASTLL